MILLAAKSVQVRNGIFEDLEPRLMSWADQGLLNESQVIAHLRALKKFEPLMHKVFELSGQDGRPGETDLLGCREWLASGHSDELILEAARQARSARQKLSYISKVLSNWQKQGIRTIDAARQADTRPAGSRGKKVAFQNYDQDQGSVEKPFVGLDLLKEARDANGK